MTWKKYKIIYLLKRILDILNYNPIRTFLFWKFKYKNNQNSGKIKPLDSPSIIIKQLKYIGIDIVNLNIDKDKFIAFSKNAGYKSVLYKLIYKQHFTQKVLEHYLSLELLDINKDDTYIDVASAYSEFPDIVRNKYNCKVYHQDLSYPEGVYEDMIGSNASNIPLPNESITKIALHNSFEHFENDSDIKFINECDRLLIKGGRVCIVPFYLSDIYYILSNPALTSREIDFDNDAEIYFNPRCRSTFERYYDIPAFQIRILKNMNNLRIKIFYVTNVNELFPLKKDGVVCSNLQFALLLEKI